ncbi:hypothetical protein C8Q72DRAFT_929327, partial [Fomitopsis betulina]
PKALQGFTVPQLKALCKEQKIAGYSKLGKAALIEKLSVVLRKGRNEQKDATGSSTQQTQLPTDLTRPESVYVGAKTQSTLPGQPGDANNAHIVGENQVLPSQPEAAESVFRPAESSNLASKKLKGLLVDPSVNLASQRHLSKDAVSTAHSLLISSVHPLAPVSPHGPPELSSSLENPCCSSTASCPVSPDAPPVRKRFLKLIVAKTPLVFSSRAVEAPQDTCAMDPPKPTCSPVLHHLDFPAPMPVPQLPSITLPPSLSQRKRVQHWAIILSGLTDAERRCCVLVSRMLRYAVYLSASHILRQRHAGLRLSQDIGQYSQAMTNMWPYLRVRETEVAERRRAYEASFLGTFMRTRGLLEPITSPLWSSPDDHRQIGMALRFVLTRLWFALSIGSGAGMGDPKAIAWLKAIVVGMEPVVAHEIWSVTVEHDLGLDRRREIMYVLEATCEPVGHPEVAPKPQPQGQAHDSAALPIRADWSEHIHRHLNGFSGSGQTTVMLDQLKWANCEEYERGISRLWLRRIEKESDSGTAKRAVAERYVLACVIANSVSGQWMSSSEMAQDFAGLSTRSYATTARPKNVQVSLYLPEHHHIESVHFEDARSQLLHVALAVVQTPHRAYFILRDNGMQVGCEEDGVSEVWQEVVGCDASGRWVR